MIIQNSINLSPAASQAAQPELRAFDAGARAVAQSPPPTAPAAAEPTAQQVQEAVDSITKALQPANSNLEFSVDPGTHIVVVKMVDSETGEVIREIPSKEILAIAESISQYQKGLLLSQSA